MVPLSVFSIAPIFLLSSAVGSRNRRALKSPAIRARDSVPSVLRKLSLKPRTPTRAATPTATESTTKANLPGADLRSRQPMAAARCQPNAGLAICAPPLDGLSCRSHIRTSVLNDQAIAQHNFAVGHGSDFGIMGHQHQRGAGPAIAVEQQVEHQAAVG